MVTLLGLPMLGLSEQIRVQSPPFSFPEPPAFPTTDLFSGPNNTFTEGFDPSFSSPIGAPPAYEFESPNASPALVPSAPFFQPPFNPSGRNNLGNNTFNSYRVEVQGRSPSLLYAVKAVEPFAFVREMDGVIQAGVFTRPDNAERRVIELKNQGVQSRVVTTSGGFSTMGQNNAANSYVATLDSQDLRYMVVIPGNSDSLDLIVNRIKNAGISSNLIRIRSGPFSPNVAVGPFASRNEADRWDGVVRSLQLDSRVRYE